MKKIFAIALAALLLFAAGCQWLTGDSAALLPTGQVWETGPATTRAATTAAPATDEPQATTPAPVPATTVRSWNGISEGDVIPGELTFYCSCEECNGPDSAGVTAARTLRGVALRAFRRALRVL